MSNHRNIKKFKGKCYNYEQKGHMVRACWLKEKLIESNVVTSNTEEDWNQEALFAIEKEGMVEN